MDNKQIIDYVEDVWVIRNEKQIAEVQLVFKEDVTEEQKKLVEGWLDDIKELIVHRVISAREENQ